ncbi:MAG: hypothetical protein HC794_06275 [Nitrospiraceae bacterium]|nr:hypothetical protein [Nitrospiraceae bacterium]
MNYAPQGKPRPVVKAGEFAFVVLQFARTAGSVSAPEGGDADRRGGRSRWPSPGGPAAPLRRPDRRLSPDGGAPAMADAQRQIDSH